MTSLRNDPDYTQLASRFTVADYKRASGAQDRAAIADAIRRRFIERYVQPVSGHAGQKHGFTIMAVSCLMIEALESFRRGWEKSQGRSKRAFRFF